MEFEIEEHIKPDNCSQPKFQLAEEEKKSCCDKVIVVRELQLCYTTFSTLCAAVQNKDMNAAVTSTSIGFKKQQFLLAALDLSPPSESEMHQMSDTVSDKIAQLSSDDMNENLLQASGLEKHTDISVDTWNNTSGMRNSRRSGPPTATQSTTLAMEKQTGKDYIVSAFKQNKMCPKGVLLRNKDKTATCPGGHAGCIANVKKLERLSQYESGREIGRNIVDAGVM